MQEQRQERRLKRPEHCPLAIEVESRTAAPMTLSQGVRDTSKPALPAGATAVGGFIEAPPSGELRVVEGPRACVAGRPPMAMLGASGTLGTIMRKTEPNLNSTQRANGQRSRAQCMHASTSMALHNTHGRDRTRYGPAGSTVPIGSLHHPLLSAATPGQHYYTSWWSTTFL